MRSIGVCAGIRICKREQQISSVLNYVCQGKLSDITDEIPLNSKFKPLRHTAGLTHLVLSLPFATKARTLAEAWLCVLQLKFCCYDL